MVKKHSKNKEQMDLKEARNTDDHFDQTEASGGPFVVPKANLFIWIFFCVKTRCACVEPRLGTSKSNFYLFFMWLFDHQL